MKQNKREIRQKFHLTGIIGYKKKLTFDILSFQIKGQISRDELKLYLAQYQSDQR